MDIAVLNRWIGEVYCDMGMFEEAIEYQKKHLGNFFFFFHKYIVACGRYSLK